MIPSIFSHKYFDDKYYCIQWPIPPHTLCPKLHTGTHNIALSSHYIYARKQLSDRCHHINSIGSFTITRKHIMENVTAFVPTRPMQVNSSFRILSIALFVWVAYFFEARYIYIYIFGNMSSNSEHR